MSNQLDPHMQIARKVRSIETVKIQLLQEILDVYKGVQIGNQREVAHNLGALIGTAYLLGVQLGISPADLDRHVESNIPRTGAEEAALLADIDAVKQHFTNKR